MRTRAGSGVPLLCMAGAILGFGSVPVFIRYFSASLDPWTVNGVRYLVAALFWLPAVIITLRQRPELSSIWRAAIIPAIPNVLGQILWAITPYYNSASVIGFVIKSAFLFTILFSFIWLPGERILVKQPLFWAGAAVSVFGVLTMYRSAMQLASECSAFGIMVLLVTSSFWGFYAVFVRKYLGNYPARLSFGVVSIYTSIPLAILTISVGDYTGLAALTTADVMILIMSGIIGIALSHVLLFRVIHAFGAVTASGSSLVCPFITFLGAYLLLDEVMTAVQWVGGITLIIGSVMLVVVQGRIRQSGRHDTGPHIS